MGRKSDKDLYGRQLTERMVGRLRRREDRQRRRDAEWLIRLEKERGTFFRRIHLVLGVVARWMSVVAR